MKKEKPEKPKPGGHVALRLPASHNDETTAGLTTKGAEQQRAVEVTQGAARLAGRKAVRSEGLRRSAAQGWFAVWFSRSTEGS